MAIIEQPKRILVTEFDDDNSLSKLIRFCTVTDMNLSFTITKEWVAAFETTYKGEKVLALPKRFSKEFLCTVTNVNDIIKDNTVWRGSTRQITNHANPKDNDQKIMLDFLLGRNKFAPIAKKGRRALFSETGSGKTYTTLKAIAEESHFAFINCPDDKAIMTWKQEIAKFTDIKEDEIGIIKGKESFKKVLKNKDKYKIVLGSSKSISAAISANNYVELEEFFHSMEFSLLIHDEAHLNIVVLFILEMIVQCKRTYYLTATPCRRLYKENKILDTLLPFESCIYQPEIIPRFTLRACKYYSNPVSPDHTKGLNKPRGFDFLAHGKYILHEKYPYKNIYLPLVMKVFNAAYKQITDKVNNKIAIVCKTKLENDILYDYFSQNIKHENVTMGIFNSAIEDMDERFLQTNANLIFTTDKSMAGIINIENLEAIILLNPITSESHLRQIAGRIRKKEGKKSLFYIMADCSFTRASKALTDSARAMEELCISSEKVELNSKKTITVEIDD